MENTTGQSSLITRAYRLLIAVASLFQSPLLLVLRLYWGWQFFLTGKGKSLNLERTANFFGHDLHIPFPYFNACVAGASECIGGLLLLAGLGSRLAALPLIFKMIIACLTAEIESVKHIFSDPDKFVSAAPFLFLLVCVIILVFGPGDFSLDWLLSKAQRRRAMGPALVLCLMVPNLARAGAPGGEEILRVGGATIRINFAANLPLPRPVVVEWVRRAAVAVTNYLSRFPVKELSLTVEPGGKDSVNDGVTRGARQIEVRLGPRAEAADLNHDWILTHEMFHLAFPTLKDRYLWMMEGLSDYLGPVARGRAGQLTPEEVWRGFVEGLPQGLPAEGDRGLDNTFTRERIYWGGNLYWLLADVQIREKTNNRRSVDDAIRAILDAGGNGGATWTLERVLKVGDTATKTTVLKDLHDELGPKPGAVDLDALWKRLGVKYNRGAITFDNAAPLAGIRTAITPGRHPGL
jgi:uncharacterized membrane protein YphA (DoxX/SURF4 family)